MSDKMMKKRIAAVRRQLKKRQMDCLIVTRPANVTYTTGFSGDYSWAIIAAGGVYLLTDSRYVEQAERECSQCRIIQRAGPMAESVGRLLAKLKSVRTAGVEESATLAEFSAVNKNVKAQLRTAANIIEQIRLVKDAGEIAAIRAASRIAEQVFKQAWRYVRQGITESELAGRLDFQIRKVGARNSFETIVAFGANGSLPHHQPDVRKLKKNDTVLIDFGVRYKNYCCDLTRCFSVGKSSTFYKKVYNAVKDAQVAALKMIKPGVKISEVDAAAREVIAGRGLPVYGHGTGHGLGLEVHEGPVISAESKGRLQAGMVFTIEPGVYIPGKLGVRIEDDVLVTKTGYKVLN